GKKRYPRFRHDCRSIEYKATSGWQLASDGRHITFRDGVGNGTLRLVRTRTSATVPEQQIKRVRIIRRAEGYYCQLCVEAERHVEHIPTGKQTTVDMGLNAFYTDSAGNAWPNPCHYRKAEKKLKKLQQRVSRKKKGSSNRKQSRTALAKQH